MTLIGGRDAGARQRVVERLRQARLAWRQKGENGALADDSLWLQTGQVAATPGMAGQGAAVADAAGQGRGASAKAVSEGSVPGGTAPVGRPASRFATAGACSGLPWGRAGLLSHASHAAGSARGPQAGVAGAPQAGAGVPRAGAAGASQAPEAGALPAEAEASAAAGPDERFAGGCICCLGGPAFRTTLVRLLRRPDWHHLYLEVNAEPEHVLRIVEQLRSPPFSQYLAIALLVEVAGSNGPAEGDDGAPWASARVTPDGGWQWLGPLAPWPAVAADPAGRTELAQSVESIGSVRPLRPVESVRPAEGAVPTWLALRWPADQGGLPSRDEVAEALWALAAVPGLLGAQAVLQGSRSAYDWRLPAGGVASADAAQEAAASADLGLSGRNLSAVLRPRETGWRLDNRLLLEMAQGIDLAALDRALLALQELWR